jgi:hypothetical protein
MNAVVADDGVVVAARETTAVVTPRTADLALVNLPALEFALRAAIRCKGDPVSLTLSIADTFVTLHRESLGDQRAAETTLTVPARQLALAASNRFCLADEDQSAHELLVPGMATAHASLTCLDDGQLAVHFASAPLQVRLSCERAPDDDQEVAAESPSPR